jgi:hypothetical protein
MLKFDISPLELFDVKKPYEVGDVLKRQAGTPLASTAPFK